MSSNTIVKAIKTAIDEFKSGTDNASGKPNINQGGFSLNVYVDDRNGKATAEVAFSDDPTKIIWFYENNHPGQVELLWNKKRAALVIIELIAEHFILKDWIIKTNKCPIKKLYRK